MDETPFADDLREFLSLLATNEVAFMLVGGFAVALHGHPRATADVDLWIDSSEANVARIARALEAFGFRPTATDLQCLRSPGKILRMGYPPARIELLTTPAGVEFEPCRARAVGKSLFGVEVPTISLDDLIVNKRATGRAKDALDADELERIRRGRRGA
jgi:predicted nucleotidyltransferase